jgi:hypothetical protein
MNSSEHFKNMTNTSDTRQILHVSSQRAPNKVNDWDIRIWSRGTEGVRPRRTDCQPEGDLTLECRPDEGGSKALWNVSQYPWDDAARHPASLPSSYSTPWETEMLATFFRWCLKMNLFLNREVTGSRTVPDLKAMGCFHHNLRAQSAPSFLLTVPALSQIVQS